MLLVTRDQMRQIDRRTIEQGSISALDLMENAGRGVAEIVLDRFNNQTPHGVLVVCGHGNNGGDGFVIARYLHETGVPVEIWFVKKDSAYSNETSVNFDRAQNLGLPMRPIQTANDIPQEIDTGLIVDALLGTGFTGTLEPLTGSIIQHLNALEIPIVSVDLPSGLDADSGKPSPISIHATLTCTLGLPKIGLYLSPGREIAREVYIVPIGLSASASESVSSNLRLMTPQDAAGLLPQRTPTGHKGDFGKVLIVAGSIGMTGAAVLVAKAALRSGCGLVTIATPESALPIIASQFAEAITHPLPEIRKRGCLALRSLGDIRKMAKEHDAIVIGPGLGRHHETFELIRRFVTTIEQPMVIDADALNAFEGHPVDWKNRKTVPILTPHDGEFKRFTKEESLGSFENRVAVLKKAVNEKNAIVVLKGSPSVICLTNGIVWVNPTGNDGMATAGSGDVLSGILGSLLAQGLAPDVAAPLGVYLHGLAGDNAAIAKSARAMIAGDIIEALPETFNMLES